MKRRIEALIVFRAARTSLPRGGHIALFTCLPPAAFGVDSADDRVGVSASRDRCSRTCGKTGCQDR